MGHWLYAITGENPSCFDRCKCVMSVYDGRRAAGCGLNSRYRSCCKLVLHAIWHSLSCRPTDSSCNPSWTPTDHVTWPTSPSAVPWPTTSGSSLLQLIASCLPLRANYLSITVELSWAAAYFYFFYWTIQTCRLMFSVPKYMFNKCNVASLFAHKNKQLA